MTTDELRRQAYALVESDLRGCDFRAILLNPGGFYFVQTASETGDFKSLREAVDTFLKESVQPNEREQLQLLWNGFSLRLAP